jgi:hypothetical protein
MSSTRDIQVSTDVYAAIWAARHPGEHTEDAILRRLLAVQDEARGSQKPAAPRSALGHSRADELHETLGKLHVVPTATNSANVDQPTGQGGSVTSSQRRWEKIADTLADPFRLVY